MYPKINQRNFQNIEIPRSKYWPDPLSRNTYRFVAAKLLRTGLKTNHPWSSTAPMLTQWEAWFMTAFIDHSMLWHVLYIQEQCGSARKNKTNSQLRYRPRLERKAPTTQLPSKINRPTPFWFDHISWIDPSSWAKPEELESISMARRLQASQNQGQQAELAAWTAVVFASITALAVWGVANAYSLHG